MKRKNLIYTVAVLTFFLSALLSICLGAVNMTIPQLWQALCSGPKGTAGYIFWYSRLPRTAACLLSGAALAVSGAVIQSVLHNRLASPSIIGVNAGAGLAVTVCCALGLFLPVRRFWVPWEPCFWWCTSARELVLPGLL